MSPLEIAVTAATSLGVRCTDPVVLHDGSNVVVHLRPAPVVARVATVTARIRPGVEAWFRRDVLVARHAAARGVPATRPFGGPVVVDGVTVALWHHEPHAAGAVFSPATVAERLADLHTVLADLDADLPRLAPCDDTARAVPLLAGQIPDSVVALLLEENERLRKVLATFPVRPLHGDAHPGNLLATPSGPMWNDFEDTFLGPLGWDLACLVMTGHLDGAAALAAYPGEYSEEEVAVCVELRDLFGVAWRFVMAQHFPARLADAEKHLRRWLAGR